ncbi:MAG: hypothetical protein HY784_09775 [Chloroflexi bacterium]|nr:hypothetical protein [Chloroflexota bacterium]
MHSAGRQGVPGRFTDDIDPELLEFLRARVNTFLKWDLVRFFHENPHTTDTAENIARYAGRDPLAIANELRELARDEILNTHYLGDLAIYTLTRTPETRDLIARFVAACEDRQFKIKAIYFVIRGMR